jgi:hypothetical protein
MTTTQKDTPMNITEQLAKLDGNHTNTKACQHCNADTEIKLKNGLTHMTIKHDDNCPLWIIIQAKQK